MTAEKKFPTWRGCLVVLGGFMIHISISLVYTFGNLIPYVASYFHAYVVPGTTSRDLVWLTGLFGIGQGGFMVVAGFLERRIGPRWCTFVGSIFLSGGLLLTSLTVQYSYPLLLLTHGLTLGTGMALAYMPPISLAMQWFPERRGLVSGCIVAGLGGGAFFLTQVQTLYLNPKNIQRNETTGFFEDEEMLLKVPSLYLVMAGITGCLQIVGIILLTPPPRKTVTLMVTPSINNAEKALVQPVQEALLSSCQCTNTKPYMNLKSAMKTREFYIFWATMFCNTCAVNFIAAVYKAFGQTFIADDQFLSIVGSIAALCNTLGRVGWGMLADKLSYKMSMNILSASFAVLLGSWAWTMYVGRFMFAAWFWLMFLDAAGAFCLFPPNVARTFGAKHVSSIYGMVCTCLVVNGPLVSLLTQHLYPLVGWSGLAGIFGILPAISVLLTIFYRKPHIQECKCQS